MKLVIVRFALRILAQIKKMHALLSVSKTLKLHEPLEFILLFSKKRLSRAAYALYNLLPVQI